jgi:hypothetical protein
VRDLLIALAIFGGVSIALCVAAVAYARWRLRKQLRVRPSSRSSAPTSWLVSTSEPARLHRRLRKATAVARVAGARGDATIASIALEIEDHAVALEGHLVALSRVWRRDREARRQMSAQVASIEQLSTRLTTTAAETSRQRALGAGSHDALAELAERIDALDAARAELASLERHWHAS